MAKVYRYPKVVWRRWRANWIARAKAEGRWAELKERERARDRARGNRGATKGKFIPDQKLYRLTNRLGGNTGQGRVRVRHGSGARKVIGQVQKEASRLTHLRTRADTRVKQGIRVRRYINQRTLKREDYLPVFREADVQAAMQRFALA